MEQNISNEMREELPAYDFAVQEYQVIPESNSELEKAVNDAFQKALASVIIINLPVVGFVGVIFGVLALQQIKRVDELAADLGVEAGGKRKAAKIMALIGTIYGSVLATIRAVSIGSYGIGILFSLI